MGSWSVYCGISNITIKEGDEMVLLPIKPKTSYEGYQPYVAATLPIFGEYGDYGMIVNIERDKNVEIIEEYFGLPIDEFVTYFTDVITYNRDDAEYHRVREVFSLKVKETKDWNFMFIHREVWDFIANEVDFTDMHIPNKSLYKSIGFEEVEENKFVRGDYSFEIDYMWYQIGDVKYHSLERSYNKINFIDLIGLTEDEKTLMRTPFYKQTQHMDKELFDGVIGRNVFGDYYSKRFGDDDMLEFFLKKETDPELKKDFIDEIEKNRLETLTEKHLGLIRAYKENAEDIKKLAGDLFGFIGNMGVGSYTLKPFIKYVTPQCGEFRSHQKILDKFASINRSTYDEDEDE